jgi:predicted house-cleaning noncanonical NTP pyrophosphatase (MazG superfamily)
MEKLVRDNIPEIAENKGQVPVIRTASKDEILSFLVTKLMEETLEVIAANKNDMPTELADVLEVVYSIARILGLSAKRLEWIREMKADLCGSYNKRVIWYGNQEIPKP